MLTNTLTEVRVVLENNENQMWISEANCGNGKVEKINKKKCKIK